MSNRAAVPVPPSGIRTGLREHPTQGMRGIGIGFLEEHQESVRAEDSSGKIEQILNLTWIVSSVSFNPHQIASCGKAAVGSSTDLDIFVGRVRTRRIEENLADKERT